MKLGYRADIDGLRSLAVLPILFYHAGLPGFSGGYVGVDIFFVISGFLITSIIAGEIARGEFSIITFYERRVRRIFPALFVMMAATICVAWFTLFPDDLEAFGRTVYATTGFIANMHFWSNSGYFDAAAETKPLMHTWSLAVEEQFYLFFPLLLVAVNWVALPSPLAGEGGAKRRMRGKHEAIAPPHPPFGPPLPQGERGEPAVASVSRPLAFVTWALLIGSLVLALYEVRVDPVSAFFLIPMRAWELLAGSVLALHAVPSARAHWQREAGGLLGLLCIAIPVFGYDLWTRFPGDTAIPPVLGAALLIWSGGDKPTLASRILTTRPLVFAGLISYSLYLWHWPVMVYARYELLRPFTLPEKFALVALSFALAVLSWRFVETPMRKFRLPRWQLFGGAAAVMSATALAGLVFVLGDGFVTRWPPFLQRLIIEVEEQNHGFAKLIGNPAYADIKLPEGGFVAGLGKGRPNVIVWGDSHVGAIMPALYDAIVSGKTDAITIFTKGGCRPLVGIYVAYDLDLTCHDQNAATLDYITRAPEKKVVLVARWAVGLFGDTAREGAGEGHPALARKPGEMMTPEDATAFFRERLSETLRAIVKAGKEVYFFDPITESPVNIPFTSYFALLKDPTRERVTLDASPYKARYIETEKAIAEAIGDLPVKRISPRAFFCDGWVCPIYELGHIQYTDTNHLSWQGGGRLGPLFDPIWAK